MSHACSMYNNHHIQFSPISVPDSHIQHMSLLTCSSCQWTDYFCQWMVILCSSCQRLWIQGFPWCCSTCKLLSLFRLSVERFVLHGLRMPSIQSNEWSTYIMDSESRLCRFAVAPLQLVRSNGLFQHHTSHKRRHQGSR